MQGIIHTNSFDEKLLRKAIKWFWQRHVSADLVLGTELALTIRQTFINLSPVLTFKNGMVLSPCLRIDYLCDEKIPVYVLIQSKPDVHFAVRFFNTLSQYSGFPMRCCLVSPADESLDLLKYADVLHVDLSGFDNKSSGSKPRKPSGLKQKSN